MYSAVVCYSCQVSEAQAFGKIWKGTMRTIYGINCIGVSAYPANFLYCKNIQNHNCFLKVSLPPTIARDVCAPAPN